MGQHADITSIFHRCASNPDFYPVLFEYLKHTAPEFYAVIERVDPENRIFMVRKCITNVVLGATGTLPEQVILEKFQRCGTSLLMTPALFSLWIDCLLRAVKRFEVVPPPTESVWKTALLSCARFLAAHGAVR